MYIYGRSLEISVTNVKCNSNSVLTIKRPKVTSTTRARGILMVKTLNKCILSSLVYNLILDIQRNILYTPYMSIHRYIGCLHEIEIQVCKSTTEWSKNRSDTKLYYCRLLCKYLVLLVCLYCKERERERNRETERERGRARERKKKRELE